MAGPLRRRRRDPAAAATRHDARATGSHGQGDSQRRALLVDSNSWAMSQSECFMNPDSSEIMETGPAVPVRISHQDI
jgi:hypothetical protein